MECNGRKRMRISRRKKGGEEEEKMI